MPTDYSTTLLASETSNFTQSNEDLEHEVMHQLIKGDAAINVASNISNSLYHNNSTNFQCEATQLSGSELNTIELLTKPGLHDGSFVVSVAYDTTDIPVNDSVSVNFGTSSCIQSKDYEIVNPTSSVYNSYIQIDATTNNGPFYQPNEISSTSRFNATFDDSYTNIHHYQKALNSRFSNTENSDPISIHEHVDFNSNNALGLTPNSWYSLNADNSGTLVENTLNSLYQHQNNKIYIETDNLNNISDSDCGTYRIQQFPNVPVIEIQEYISETMSVHMSSNHSDVYPFHIGASTGQNFINGSLTRLPQESISLSQFKSIFDLSSEVIVPGYEFNLNVTPKSNSGFNYSDGTKVNDLATINDNDIYDNLDIMSTWINRPLTLTYNDATVTLSANDSNNNVNLTNGLISLDTGRESLDDFLRSQNGEIKINTRSSTTRTTINDQDSPSLETLILYPSDNINYLNTIDENLKTNRYANVFSQLVFKNPAFDTLSFLTHGDSALNIASNGTLLNNSFNVNDWEFTSYKSAEFGSTKVWSITPQVKLNGGINAFRKIIDDTIVPNVFQTIYLENLKLPADQGTINGARANVMPKLLDTFSFGYDLSSYGWNLTNDNNSHDYVFSSSDNAFNADGIAWPTLDEVNTLFADGNESLTIPFRFTFGAGDGGNSTYTSSKSSLLDRITIEWGDNYTNSFTVSQSALNMNVISTNTTSTVINPSNYNLLSYMYGKNVELSYVETIKTYNMTFDTHFRPYTNLYCTTPNYTIKTQYYVIRDLSSSNVNPFPSGALLNVKGINSYSGVDFSKTLEQIISQTPTVVTGTIIREDLKEITARIQMDTAANSWFNISEEKSLSMFFESNPIILNLNQAYDTDLLNSDINFWIQYVYMDENGAENVVLIDDPTGYYISLQQQIDVTVSLYSWEITNELIGNSQYSDIALNTNIISPSNAFSSINGWINNDYSISITIEDEGQTVAYTVTKNSDQSTEFVIKLKNGKIMGMPLYVSRAREDIWRIRTGIGAYPVVDMSYNNIVPDEIFRSTIYSDVEYVQSGTSQSNAETAVANKLALLNGVYLKHSSGVFNFSTVGTAGKYIDFDILQDKISANLVGSASTLSEIDNLSYLYEYDNYFSKTLNLTYYRGYLGLTNVDQVYTVNRQQTTATWAWSYGGSTYYQTVPVYYSSQPLNNFLLNGAQPINFNKLNVKLEFNYSMLADNDSRVYTLNSVGDDVTITVVNPNVSTFTPVTINKTLKDNTLYTFSGTNYNSSSNPLVIRSSRLKINNSNLNDALFNRIWRLKLDSGALNIYHLTSDIGNPAANISSTPSSELNPNVGPSLWGSAISSTSYADTLQGVSIPGYTIRRYPDVNYDASITFFVIARPMLRFTCYRNNYCPASLPFNPFDVNFINGNTKEFYLPINDYGSYYPFDSSISRTDINGVTRTYTNDLTEINNIHFIDTGDKTFGEFVNNADNSYYSILVRGSNLVIQLVVGILKNQNINSAITTITLFDDTAEKLLDLTGVSTILKLEEALNVGANGYGTGAKLSFLQKSVSPYYYINQGYSNVFFNVPSFFMSETSNSIQLDLSIGNGTIMRLYTREIVKDVNTNAYKVILYKYIPVSNHIDYTNSVVSAEFYTRYKKEFNLPARSFYSNTIQKFGDLLNLITKNDVINTSWTLEGSYNTLQWIAFTALNQNCVTNVNPKLFQAYNLLGHAKYNIFTRSKILLIKDKLDNIIGEINHDAIYKTPLVSSGGIILQNMDNYTKPDEQSDMMYRSVFGFNRQLP